MRVTPKQAAVTPIKQYQIKSFQYNQYKIKEGSSSSKNLSYPLVHWHIVIGAIIQKLQLP